ncbi:MAG: tetratricopeptide repeat protein [Anaerolineales bacterium]|nr:tetratricopeptide repeat protein [Anaerolineales bacterium]
MPDAVSNVLDNYRAAVGANPTSAEAQSNLGWGLYGQRLFDESVRAFEAALALDNLYVDAHYGLALTLKESGAPAKAVSEFQAVLKLAPQMDNTVRAGMLARLARGHINQIESGNWRLDAEHGAVGG